MNLSTGFFCDGCKKDLSAPTCFYHSKKDYLELDFCLDCFKKLSIELDYFYRPHAIDHTKREWEKMQKEWNCISCKQYLGSVTKWSMFHFVGLIKEKGYHICDTCIENESLISSLFVYIDTNKNLIEMKSGEICDFTNLPDNEHVRMRPNKLVLSKLGDDFIPKQEFVKEWYNLCYEIVYLSPKFDSFGSLAEWIPLMKPTIIPGTNSKYILLIENSLDNSRKNTRIAVAVIDDKRRVHCQVIFNTYEDYVSENIKSGDIEDIVKRLSFVT